MKNFTLILLVLITSIANSQTWEQVPYYFPRYIQSAPKIFTSPDDVLVAGVRNNSAPASHISLDGGDTWQQIFTDKPVVSVEFGPDGAIYFISSKRIPNTSTYPLDTLYRSTDGVNWTNMGYKLTGGNKVFNEYNFVISANNTLLFPNHMSGSGGINLSVSTDNGLSWTPTTMSASPFSCSQTADTIITSFGSPWPGGINYSHDGGATVNVATGISAESYPVRLPNGDVYAATLGQFYKSTDGGATFTQIAAPSSFGHVQEFLYAANGKFYIRVSGAVTGIWETSDFVTFNAVTATLPDWNLLSDMEVSNNYLYAIADTNVYKLPLGTSTSSLTNIQKQDDFLKIYPNPAKENISIVSSFDGNTLVEIFDLQGKRVYKNNFSVTNNLSTNISLHNILSGVYFIRLTNENGEIQNQKLLIK
jgi:hypothetical protein